MRSIKNLDDVRQVLSDFETTLNGLKLNDQDFHGRRVTNAGNAVGQQDYVTLSQLKDKTIEITKEVQISTVIPEATILTAILTGGTFTVDDTFQDLPGVTIGLRSGKWLVFGIFEFDFDENASLMEGQLVFDGVAQPGLAVLSISTLAGSATWRGTISYIWKVSGSGTAKLQAKVAVNSGINYIQTQTKIVCFKS